MRLTWLNPAGLERRTGGTLYNRHVLTGLRQRGWDVDVRSASDGVVHVDGLTVVDGLIWPDVDIQGGPTVALIHSPLFRERGGDWRGRERRALDRADFIAGTSRLSLDELGVDGAVFQPGVHPAPVSLGHGVLKVAHLIPRKGHEVLLQALDRLEAPPRVRCAGSAEVDPDYAADLLADRRCDWLGEVQDLEPEYQRAGLLVHTAAFEGWGMALDEARVRGLEVITTPAGALERHRGQVCEVPQDPTAIANAIAAWQRGQRWSSGPARLPTWDDVAAEWHHWLIERTNIG